MRSGDINYSYVLITLVFNSIFNSISGGFKLLLNIYCILLLRLAWRCDFSESLFERDRHLKFPKT